MRKRTLVLPPSLISNCRHRILSGRQICSRAQDRRTAIVRPVMTEGSKRGIAIRCI